MRRRWPLTWGIKRGGYTPTPTEHRTATPPPAPPDRGADRWLAIRPSLRAILDLQAAVDAAAEAGVTESFIRAAVEEALVHAEYGLDPAAGSVDGQETGA